MKTIYALCLGLCLSLAQLLVAQAVSSGSSPYGLNNAQWEKVNRVWKKKARMVALLTSDSMVYYGQILAVTDTSLLFYTDTGFVDSRKTDVHVKHFKVQDIAAIFTVKEYRSLSKSTRKIVAGGMIGATIGIALHLLLPENVFHPIFIAPAAGSGLLAGLGLGAGQRDAPIIIDTTFIFTQEEYTDTIAPDSSVLIWSTYKYAVWQDGLPDSVKWNEEHFEMDSAVTFDDLAFDSRRILRAFPTGNAYFSVSFKSTQTKYGDPVSFETMYMLNGGYRLNENWALDAYFNKHSCVVGLHSAIGGLANMSATSAALTCSYSILKHDRYNTQPVQISAGVGAAYSAITFGSGFNGRTKLNQNNFGFMCKIDIALFLTRRLAIVLDAQQTFLQPVTLKAYDWTQWQTTIAIPAERITTSYFQFASGLRLHF